ncbi:MAG: hypothetical protein JNK87_11060 [Bryobacterales bacterium]|nr:hypothetical protein [Bryobacterales bacterium]
MFRVQLSRLLKAKADLTGQMALRFEKAFGVDMATRCAWRVSTTFERMRSGTDDGAHASPRREQWVKGVA